MSVCRPRDAVSAAVLRQQTNVELEMNIYVGNLSFDTAEEDLRRAFENFGQVSGVNIIMDRETGRSRGFGFVEMPSKEEGEAAIAGLNGQDLGGRKLNVNEARSRQDGGGRDDGRRGGY
jgi:RNA recognition motif-containing protein